jgi:arylsulfatase A-like enzyme
MEAVLLGAFAGLLCGLVETLWLLLGSLGYFDGPLEMLRLLLVMLALGGGVGALAGALEGAVHRFGSPLWKTLLCSPFVAWICMQIFRGPQARNIPHHDLIAVAIGVVALAAIHFGQRILPRVPLWLAALAMAILYAADQKLLPRLYPFFHQGLGVLVFAAAQLVIFRSKKRVPTRWAIPALVGLCLAGSLSLVLLGRQRALRTLVLDRGVLSAPIARLAPTPKRATAEVTVAKKALLPPGPRLGDPDVFLITIDAFRADRLDEQRAPNLSRLAARGVRFSHAYAQVPHTSFSIATLLTGKYVYSLSTLGLEAAGHQTLAQVMKRERYKTAAFYPPSVFYIDHDRLKELEASAYGFEYVKYEYLAAPERTQQIIDFFAAEKPRRAFVWVHYLEPHEPYDPHPGHDLGSSTEARYDGEIHFVDAEVQRLVDWIQQNRPHSLIVVAADHGEEFGEHGGHYHGTTLYEEQVRVPLFFTALDDNALPPRLVHGNVGLVDVGPTILPLLGIPPSAKMRGRDLGPWLLGAPDGELGPIFAEIDRQKSIVDGHDKLICDLEADACKLFDLEHDPREQKNLIESQHEKADKLRATLDGWMREEMRFEHAAGQDAETRRVFERARMGEKSAAPALAKLLGGKFHDEAAQLLVRLPPDPATAPFLVGDDPWIQVARARLQLPAQLPACKEASDLCCHVALLKKDPEDLSRALDFVTDDRELEVQLVEALGRSHDPRALDPLLIHLAAVRTRVETVHAIEELNDARAVPWLARWMPNDPYIPVRAQMATTLGKLGGPEARAAIRALLTVEKEPEVISAARNALR